MDIFSHPSLQLATIMATIIYSLIGVVVMLLGVTLFDKMFNLDLHKELVEDQNLAFGVLLGGLAIGISVIIAAAIIG